MTTNWIWTLDSQKYFIYTKHLSPQAQILVHFALQTAVFKIQCRRKSEMHRMTPNWTWTLNSKKYSYRPTLNPYPCGPNFGLFRSTTNRFRDTRSPKIRKAHNDPQTEVKRLSVKSTCINSQKYPAYTKYLSLRPKFCSVSLYD